MPSKAPAAAGVGQVVEVAGDLLRERPGCVQADRGGVDVVEVEV